MHALPDFPWDTIAEARRTAQAHPDGIVDLSVGGPVDPVAPSIREALASASAASSYPQTMGTPQLRDAAARALVRRYGTIELDPETMILPAVGTKELIAGLPLQLGLGVGDLVVLPEVAYPTYEVGALLADCEVLRADSLTAIGPRRARLLFLNSPSNPTGKVLPVEHLRKVVAWARERNVIVASDECYLGLSWEGAAPSILDPAVCDGDPTNLLALHSLSKTSNLAGYRAGFAAGDPALLRRLLAVRKHWGLIMPMPVQAATTAALTDDEQEAQQRARYRVRRERLREAVLAAGFRVDHSEAGLYLWVTRGEDARTTHAALAELGILGAPGDFYGPRGAQHVRLALTAADERIAEAARRLKEYF